MSRKPSSESARGRFAALLTRHLSNGTRPATDAGEPWTYVAFAGDIPSSRAGDGYASQRAVSNWCKGTSLPGEIEPILRALFGPASGTRHTDAREELRRAFSAARGEMIEKGKRDTAGALWVPAGDEVAIDRTAHQSDQLAAKDPLRQQMQGEISLLAAELIEPAKRLLNTRVWSRLSKTAEDFFALVSADPQEMPSQLSHAYALLTRLGGFLETDVRLQRDRAALDDPLAPDIQGILAQLVRLAALWLRGFPTVARLDDAAGKFLARDNLVQPAREFVRRAHAAKSISVTDVAEMELLGETASADSSGFQGDKAGNRLVGSSKNLMLTLGQVGNENTMALRARRAREALMSAPDEVAVLAASWPPDLHQAVLSLVGEWSRSDRTDKPGHDDQEEREVPLEVRTRDLVLANRAPPAAWTPFITALDFSSSNLTSLQLPLLAPLHALRHLDLSGTQVKDLSPLEGLTGLKTLFLSGTLVNNLLPLAGLTALEALNLTRTQVENLSPLAGLTALTTLTLTRMAVREVSPLAGLTALVSLDLSVTPVNDLSPLAGLVALAVLHLTGTSVSDLSPLSGLTNLTILHLPNTAVREVAPLARLTALEFLILSHTQVTDLSPLGRLTALRHLDLNDTRVSDLSPLARLTSLKHLDLSDTEATDLSPLEGLTTLETLYLNNTGELDVSQLERLKIMNLSVSKRQTIVEGSNDFPGSE